MLIATASGAVHDRSRVFSLWMLRRLPALNSARAAAFASAELCDARRAPNAANMLEPCLSKAEPIAEPAAAALDAPLASAGGERIDDDRSLPLAWRSCAARAAFSPFLRIASTHIARSSCDLAQ